MNDFLIPSISNCRKVLAAKPYFWGYTGWLENLNTAVDDLVKAFRNHASNAEAPDGVLDILQSPSQETVPTLQRCVTKLRHDHISLLDEAENVLLRVRDSLRKGDARHSAVWVQKDGYDLLDDLDNHLYAENKLFQESMNTVVGVGD
jgi:hypothetical protein